MHAIQRLLLHALYRLNGIIHNYILIPISIQYATRDPSVLISPDILPLPFNLVLKDTGSVCKEEYDALKYACSIGLPVPRAIAFGDHGDGRRFSILMTRIPGRPLDEVFSELSAEQLDTIREELVGYLKIMRSAKPLAGQKAICGVNGGRVRGKRVPSGGIKPCSTEREFLDELFKVGVSSNMIDSPKVVVARRLYDLADSHRIVFTHGDLWHHNIIVENGHISGIVDWETAAWLPEHWEFTSVARWTYNSWSKFLHTIPEFKAYEQELVSDSALAVVCSDSYSYM